MSKDEILMEKLTKRDKRAMSELYDRYHQMVWKIAWRKHADPVYCEQLVLQVFEQLWQQPNNFNGNQKVAAFILDCCRSKIENISNITSGKDDNYSISK